MMDLPNILFFAGVAIFSTMMILQVRLRYQREARRAAERRAAAQAAKEAERKRQAMTGEPLKVKLAATSRVAPDRVPLGEPFDAAFAGGVPPRSIAKWETEIHQIGRQMVGQIDSKSVVLQTLTMEANRAANRLEILIDHLETLLKDVAELRKPADALNTTVASTNSSNAEIVRETVQEIVQETVSRERSSNLIPAEAVSAQVQVESFADVLEELENELDRFHDLAKEEIPTATILKVPPPTAANETLPESSSELPVRRLSASINVLPQHPGRAQETVAPPPTGSTFDSENYRISIREQRTSTTPVPPSQPSSIPLAAVTATPPTQQPQRPSLSFSSLFDDNLMERLDESSTVSVSRQPVPRYETPLIEQSSLSKVAVEGAAIDNRFVSEIGAHLDLRKKVEMLADYGYSAGQIAQSLDITVGEVELMISLRN